MSKLQILPLWLALVTTLAGSSRLHGQTGETALDFNRDIRPILAENCFHCHGPDAATRKAKLRLDTEAGATRDLGGYTAIAPGQPAASVLLDRITHSDPDEQMPPPDSNKQLTAAEKERLRNWIAAGAPWAQHWAFVPPRRPALPTTPGSDWGHNEIDAFISQRLHRAGLAPAPPATKATLARRVSLDLTGLPPTPERVKHFERDTRPDAYERFVDELLHSSRYGEHMAWQWLDAARYADTDGYQNDGPRDMWRWRDWVIQAYNANLPFDQFTIEQLAGDLLPEPTLEQVIATGFNRNHRYNSEAGLVFEEFLLENAVDRVDTTATVWMGLTVGCARCHDHKYDPISQAEYYQLVAHFNSVPESGRAIKFGNSEPWIKAPTPQQQERLTQLTNAVAQAEAELQRQERSIAVHQAAWEETLQGDKLPAEPTVLPTGLSHHFARTEPLRLDGESGVEFEKIPNLICNGRFSIAFHATPSESGQGAILSNEKANTGRNGILVQQVNHHLRFQIISRWIAGVATLETLSPLPAGEPVHIALTNDGTQRAKGMRIYLNGKAVATRTLHNSNSNKSGKDFGDVMRAGTSPHVPGWKGTIRDLRFYNHHTLRPEEVALLAVPESAASILALTPEQRSPAQKTKLCQYFLDHGAPLALEQLCLALNAARADYLDYFDGLPTTMVMEEMPEPRPTHVRVRGVYHQKGNRVQRGVPSIFPQPPAGSPKNRLGLAQWLVSGEHPLTARVQVNRYWQQCFGRGLVATPEDFGVQGELPSHPELLDWLAVEFVDSGWDVHHLLKTIVTSATYQQQSRRTPLAATQDPDNRLLSHAPRLRLKGNRLRDQALFASGLLVERQGGPSVKPPQPARLWAEASNFRYQPGKGADLYRRSLYTYWKRTLAPPSMALLDTADREWCSVRTKQTNTPLQALTLLNEPAFVEAAVHLGQRILGHPAPDLDAKIAFGFQVVTSRNPSSAEQAVLSQAYQKYHAAFQSDPKAAQRLVTPKAPDKSRLSGTALTDRAAATALANVLLNLDEATTRE